MILIQGGVIIMIIKIEIFSCLLQLAEIGGIPDGLLDIWEVTGKRPEAKHTWDMSRNDNLEMQGKYKPKLRFDRMYMRHSQPAAKLKAVYFELVGIERLTSCRRFPSDHWGILSHFNKVDGQDE